MGKREFFVGALAGGLIGFVSGGMIGWGAWNRGSLIAGCIALFLHCVPSIFCGVGGAYLRRQLGLFQSFMLSPVFSAVAGALWAAAFGYAVNHIGFSTTDAATVEPIRIGMGHVLDVALTCALAGFVGALLNLPQEHVSKGR